MIPRNIAGIFFGDWRTRGSMANAHETEQNIGNNGNGVRSIPVHDMPDFTAALEGYRELLTKCDVTPQDADKAVDRSIDRIAASSHKRRDGNRFINFVNDLSKNSLPW